MPETTTCSTVASRALLYSVMDTKEYRRVVPGIAYFMYSVLIGFLLVLVDRSATV